MTKTNNRPSHVVSIVEGEGDKSVWTEIGAMWPHKDGQGFQLNLKAIPVSGRLTVRVWTEKPKQERNREGA